MGKEWREHDIIRYKVFISCCDRVEKCLTTDRDRQQMRVESREEEIVCLYEDDGGRTSAGRGR